MRARAAYISSLGTTGILVSSALFMLTMVSALVAFRGWPGMTPGGGVQAVPLQSSHSSPLVSVGRPTPPRVVRAAAPAAVSKSGAAAASIARNTSTAGLVKQVPARGPATAGGAPPMTPAPTGGHTGPTHPPTKPPPPQPGPPALPDPPSPQQTLPIPTSPPDPNSTVSTVNGLLGGPTPPGSELVIALLP